MEARVLYIFRLHRIVRARFYHVTQLLIGSLRIFDRNKNPNIRLPNYSKTHSPTVHTHEHQIS